jgi:hypothetical protein
MQKARVYTLGETLLIEAPEGKTMVFDGQQLNHGILTLGDYGPSGQKIAAFKDWSRAEFFADGYTITVENPF